MICHALQLEMLVLKVLRRFKLSWLSGVRLASLTSFEPMPLASRCEFTTPLIACSVNRSNNADVQTLVVALPLAVDLHMKAETVAPSSVAGAARCRCDGLIKGPLHHLRLHGNLSWPRLGCLTKFDCGHTSVLRSRQRLTTSVMSSSTAMQLGSANWSLRPHNRLSKLVPCYAPTQLFGPIHKGPEGLSEAALLSELK